MWIWIDAANSPELSGCRKTVFEKRIDGVPDSALVEFSKQYDFKSPAASLNLHVSGDTAFQLFINGNPVWSGPAPVGRDWLPLNRIPAYYYDAAELALGGAVSFEITAEVRIGPVRMNELSLGKGGFFLEGDVKLEDGSAVKIRSDSSWKARRRRDYIDSAHYNGSLDREQWSPAKEIEDIWHPVASGIPVRTTTSVRPSDGEFIMTAPEESQTRTVVFDRIYSGYACISADGPCEVRCEFFERFPDRPHAAEDMIFREGESFYRSPALQSIGGIVLNIRNLSKTEFVSLHTTVDFTRYPVAEEGSFKCSEPGLEKVYDVCKWTLGICRQNMHFDSPKHQEPLACTGDYYIESMMTAFTFGDMRLAAFDVRRTAGMLAVNDGRLFHTSYSLIWVKMLRDVFMFTGELKLLSDCVPALELLLKRFRTYLGSNGIIDNPPDYMFVDWLVEGKFTLHHPPKYLGQTVLNAFYHGALIAAAEIYDFLGDGQASSELRKDAEQLRCNCNALLYDPEKQLYFDGLDTPSEQTNNWQPANVPLKHFSRHANTLAVLCGLADDEDAAAILQRTLESDMQEVQPYFMHFVLEAVHRCGLFQKYGLEILRKWIPLVEECSKGLKEGWFAPEKGYNFDYSHAWGGTPAYQIPARLLGFEMIEPGFKKISLTPELFGLENAAVEMPTPFGMLRCSMQKGFEPVLNIPAGLNVVIRKRTKD